MKEQEASLGLRVDATLLVNHMVMKNFGKSQTTPSSCMVRQNNLLRGNLDIMNLGQPLMSQ